MQLQGILVCLFVMPKYKIKGLYAFLEWSKGRKSSSRKLTNLAHIVPKNQENKKEVSALLQEAASCDDQDLDKIVQIAYGINLAEFRGKAEALTVSRSVSAIGNQESNFIGDVLGFSTKQIRSQSRPKSSGPSRRDIETNSPRESPGSVTYF